MAVHSVNHKKRVIGCFLLLLLLIFGSAFGFALYKSAQARKEKELKEKTAKKISQPPCFEVVITNLISERVYTGIISADKDIMIGAAVNGEIKNIFVEIGAVVTQGQALIELDKRYKQIDVRKARATVLESDVALSNATIDLINNQKLKEANIVGDDILRKYIVAHRNAIAKCERDQALLDFALEQLQDCTITAPSNGKISKRYVDIGERVGNNQQLLDMVVDIVLRVNFFVEDRDVIKLFPGKKMTFKVDIYPDNVFTATIKYISSNVEPNMRLYKVEAEYDNSDFLLKPGMIVKAKVPIRTLKNIIVIPSSTISHFGNGDFVVLYQGESNVETKVTTSWEYKGWTQITDGLKPGDKVILK